MQRNSTIRGEQPGGATAIRAVNLAAFPTDFEADLVDRLRPRCTRRSICGTGITTWLSPERARDSQLSPSF